jgi:hypothetical protein
MVGAFESVRAAIWIPLAYLFGELAGHIAWALLQIVAPDRATDLREERWPRLTARRAAFGATCYFLYRWAGLD